MESETLDCDFLIVGAGSSGCVLASRLVRRGLKVLLVEKGTTDPDKLRNLVLRASEFSQSATHRGPLLERFITVPQTNLYNRRLHAMRGRGGGGSSNINACLYCRGREEDYKGHWPWKLEDIEASFESIEAELTLEEHKSTSSVVPSWEHMLQEVGCERASLAGEAASHSHGDIVDRKITWTKLGLGGCPNIQTTMKGGERQSAWAAFVAPVALMPNLRIKSDATVSRIIIERGRAVGIEVSEHLPTWTGGRTRLRQLRLASESAEIVLSCGAFRTPKLLMLSGVGPKEHLEDNGVPVVVDMPQVGANLYDHLIAPILHFSKVPLTPADYSESSLHEMAYISCPSRLVPGESEAVANAGGSTANTGASADASPAVLGLIFADGRGLSSRIPWNVRLNITHPGFLGEVIAMVVTVLVWAAFWLTPLGWFVHRSRPVYLLLTTVKSRGTVRLASRDPSRPPVIDPAYLSHPDDERVAAEGWHMLRRARTETIMGKTLLGYEVLPGKTFSHGRDDKSFLDFFKRVATPFFHPVGTCRMGQGPEDSVVSADSLRVHGVAGLRVADASVAPRIPTGPTQAMSMMIGDRAAAMVVNDDQVQARMLEAASKSIN